MIFGKKGKLSPRYVGSFEIIERIGEVAYRLALPPALSRLHDVFHVSMLKKYLHDPSHILSYESLDVDPKLTYEAKLVEILDRKDKVLRNKIVPLIKVLWLNHVWKKPHRRQKRICERDIRSYFKFHRQNSQTIAQRFRPTWSKQR